MQNQQLPEIIIIYYFDNLNLYLGSHCPASFVTRTRMLTYRLQISGESF